MEYLFKHLYNFRILILDFDVHHGNGTQHYFYDNPKVLYISIHRYDNGKFYPRSKEGNYNFTGVNDGEGYNVNIPLNLVSIFIIFEICNSYITLSAIIFIGKILFLV